MIYQIYSTLGLIILGLMTFRHDNFMPQCGPGVHTNLAG